MRPRPGFGLIRGATVAALLTLVSGCVEQPAKPPAPKLVMTPLPGGIAALPGWTADRQGVAIAAFRRSCAVLLAAPPEAPLGPEGMAGTAADWRQPCLDAAALDPADDGAARGFLERGFVAFRMTDNGNPDGLFTGYYEAELRGARRRDGRFATPLLRRPPDLVGIDLGLFRPELRGVRLAGRLDGGELRPYPARAEIEAGALDPAALALLWVDDPVDAFFLHIQGSGRVDLADGSVVRVGYDGQNGRAYVPIGRILAERGEIPKEQLSMQTIRAWLAAHPGEAKALMDENPSYVFFRELPPAGPEEGPPGAAGVPLAPGRSLAVDRGFLPLGVPLWLDAEDADEPGGRIRRLVVAQDTGGAIRGPVRGDLFWGHGAEATRRAGMMKARGTYYMLLPAGVAARRYGA